MILLEIRNNLEISVPQGFFIFFANILSGSGIEGMAGLNLTYL